MPMINDIPWLLLEKYFSNKVTLQEKENIISWKTAAPENELIFGQLEDYFNENRSLPINYSPDAKIALKKISKKFPQNAIQVKWFSPLWKAAAIILLIIGCWWFVHQYIFNKNVQAYVTIITSDSLGANVVLPDSSHIWLNCGSSLKYPKAFAKIRSVKLTGEAYFEIAHDTLHPFIISAGNTQTRVVGTKFNIRAYANENNVELTLTQGKVQFGRKEKNPILILPGEKGIFDNETGEILKIENNNPNFLAWKTREFYFYNCRLEYVFEELSEVYHFKYQIENNGILNRKLSATFIKRPLVEVLQTIAVSAEINVFPKDGIYIIK